MPIARSSIATWASSRGIADYNTALQINPNYDVAYIGRGNVYRQASRTMPRSTISTAPSNSATTDGRAYHNRGLIFQKRNQQDRRSTTSRRRSRSLRIRRSPTMAAASRISRWTTTTTLLPTSITRSNSTATSPSPGLTKHWSMSVAATRRRLLAPIVTQSALTQNTSRPATALPASAQPTAADIFDSGGTQRWRRNSM